VSLSDALAQSRESEQRKAARALLARPMLTARGQHAAFTLVRRHAEMLRAWFDRHTGWRLIVDSEVARLVKTAATADETHPARDPHTRVPFARRRYVLVCLALAALDRADAQITLGRLAEQVVLGAADPGLVVAGVAFTLERRDERSDLVAVVRLLLDLGVLARVAGDEDAFVREAGDALYDVDRRVLSTVLAPARGPSTIDEPDTASRIAALVAELPATTDDLRNRAIRHRITRALLEDPVLYYDELSEAELTYLTGQRHAITARITELTGLVAEVRAEGVAMVDPYDDLTDVRMPEKGTDGHVTLLLAEHLAERPDEAVGLPELHEHVRAMVIEHRAYWKAAAREPGAEVELTETALTRLEALRLIRRTSGDGGPAVVARPALARYAVTAPTIIGRSG
jgi:uncharacterized protein (TIGR02678 family)